MVSSQPEFERTPAYLAAIIASSDDAIISKDLNGIVRSFNAAAERLFGYTADEIVGQPVSLLMPDDRQHEEPEILARLRRGERIQHFETVRRAKDGRLLDISLSVSPVQGPDGQIIGAAKIARDITEAKRAARVLAAQQAWFRITLQSVGDAVITCDPGGRVTFMNAEAERLTGWLAAEALAQPLADVFRIVNEQTREHVENPAERVLRHGVTMGLANHTVLLSRSGEEWPIDDSAAPIMDDQRRILGVVLVFHDVTQQRRAAAEVAEQREWLQTTLQSIGDAVIATNIVGEVILMNPVAEHLTGWTLARAQGRHCSEVFHIVNETTRLAVTSPITRVLEEGQVVGLANHTVLIAADGTERAIDDSGAPIRDASGRISGAVLVFRDITERRTAEIDRQAAAEEREQLLRRERQARADAERADRVKDEFVAMVSHELRTPLSAILGWAAVLESKRGDEALVRHGLSIIERNARLQGQLVSDLLDMSRIASDKLLLELERVELAPLLAVAVDSVRPLAEEKGVTLSRDADGDLPPTLADSARLQQIVWNLLTNAIKFTPAGGRVELRTRRVGDHAEIVVQDTGIGIAAAEMAQLFQRFHQSGPSNTRRFGGLGIGLTISKHLAELHGGTLCAASEGEGHGATFTLDLPLAPVDAERAGPGTAALEPADLPSLRGLRVLVVEDDPDMRELIRRVLEERGADVWVADSARTALARLDPTVDLLVSDIRMPDMDGYELMRRIRQGPDPVARIPAVALTAFARTEDRARALQAGFQTHIAKPFEPSDLVRTLASFAGIVRADHG